MSSDTGPGDGLAVVPPARQLSGSFSPSIHVSVVPAGIERNHSQGAPMEITEPRGFSITAALRFGWEGLKGQLALFAGLVFLTALLYAVPYVVGTAVGGTAGQVLRQGLELTVIPAVVVVGWIGVCLRRLEGERAALGDAVSSLIVYVRMILTGLVYLLAVGVGLLLLVIPGVIAFVRLGLYGWLIVDRGLGPGEALEESYRMTDGAFWSLLGLWAVFLGVFFLVGILASAGNYFFRTELPLANLASFAVIPVLYLAFTHAYQQLSRRLDETEDEIDLTGPPG